MVELYIAGIAVGLFSILIMVSNGRIPLQNKFLIAILTLWIVRFVILYSKSTSLVQSLPALILFDQNLFFLDGVLLYFYSNSILGGRFSWKKVGLHLVPFLISCGLSIITYQMINPQDLIEIYQEAGTKTPQLTNDELIFISLVIFHNVIYLWYTRLHLVRYNSRLLNSYSNITTFQLKWLNKLIVLWLILLVIPFIIYFINYINSYMSLGWMNGFLSITLFLSIFIVSYHSIRQEYSSNTDLILRKTALSKISFTEKEIFRWQKEFKILVDFMKNHEPFLDPLLSIDKLAELTNKDVTEVSYTINRGGQMNFYEFVNSFRLEKVKEQLVSSEDQVMQIAYRNGFNSKSAFYDTFRKETNTTPSKYRKKVGHIKKVRLS